MLDRLNEIAQTDTMSQPELIGARDAAQVSGRSVATVKRAARSGELPFALKMPGDTGAYLFVRSTVERWAATFTASDTGSAA